MATTYTLLPEPLWYIVNHAGTAAGGAKIHTRSNQNYDVLKPVYRDAGGVVAWPNPILVDLNGVAPGPIFWAFNAAAPNDLYYIKVTDADDVLIWDMPNFSGAPGGGGGGNINTFLPLTNYINNNQFIDHIDETPLPGVNHVIAPSNHKGFTPALSSGTPIIGTNGAVGPDIRFVKGNTSATDNISFPLFLMGSSPLSPDNTPVDYVRYTCSGAGSSEGYKAFQFPITQKVKNLSNQSMTFKVWAAVAATPATIGVSVRQYFGSSPTADAEVVTPQNTMLLSTTWTEYTSAIVIPSVATKSLGTAGQQTDDDAVYIWLTMPLDATCDVYFTKPKLYLGTIPAGQIEFQDYDSINAINSTPRTGDIRVSLTTSPPNGWVAMDDTSIGDLASNATGRANQDTFQLFKTIWDGVSNTYAPTQDSAGVATARGASAVADFVAHKRLVLPRSLGRALAGAGSGASLTATTLGEWQGADTTTLLSTNLPIGTPYSSSGVTADLAGNNTGAFHIPGSAFGIYNSGPTTPVGTPISIIQPTTYFNVFIKL